MLPLIVSSSEEKVSVLNSCVCALQSVPKKRLIRLIRAVDLYIPNSQAEKSCLPRLAGLTRSLSQRVTDNPACPKATKAWLIRAKAVATCEPVPPAPIRCTLIGLVALSKAVSVKCTRSLCAWTEVLKGLRLFEVFRVCFIVIGFVVR